MNITFKKVGHYLNVRWNIHNSILVKWMHRMCNVQVLLFKVGPKKKNLKVKNLAEFEFKPQELVSNICQIYINLGHSGDFCEAVSRDGRSYSESLFPLAQQVLIKIGRAALCNEVEELANKIKVCYCYCCCFYRHYRHKKKLVLLSICSSMS